MERQRSRPRPVQLGSVKQTQRGGMQEARAEGASSAKAKAKAEAEATATAKAKAKAKRLGARSPCMLRPSFQPAARKSVAGRDGRGAEPQTTAAILAASTTPYSSIAHTARYRLLHES